MAGETTLSGSLLDPAFLRKLERLAIAVKRAQLGAMRGERRSKRRGAGFEFADYREYAQGDDTRYLDWNIYSRLDSLYLKLFQEEEDLTVHLIIDASRSMTFGTPGKLDFARRLAAAIGYVALVGFDRVAVASCSGDSPRYLTPCRGKLSAGKLFSFLESIEGNGVVQLEASCRSYFNRNNAKGVVVVISDFLDPEGPEGCLRRISLSGSDAYAITVLAPEEINPQLSGDLKLRDSETDAFTEVSVSRALLKRYKDNLDAFAESLRKQCLARGIRHFMVSSDTPIERLTLEVLRKGGMLK